MEEEPFNPDYVEVDRVLEVSFCEDKDTGEVNIQGKNFFNQEEPQTFQILKLTPF